MEFPRRKTNAGPTAQNPEQEQRKSFMVTGTYVRGQEKGLEDMLKTAVANEDLKITGPLSVVSSIETTKEVLCCKYTEEFEALAAGFTDGTVRMFKSNTAEQLEVLSDSETQAGSCPVTSIEHRPVSKNYPITNCITCTYANGCVKCWNYNFGQCIYTIREKRQTFGMTYHPRLPKFITYGDNFKIYLYDEETRTQERILCSSEAPGALDGHVSRIFGACFNPKSNHELITGGWDDVILFWDLRQPHATRRISGVHVCGEGLDINAKGTEILSCAWQKDHPLAIWDYGTGNLIVHIEPDVYESMLYCGKFINKDYVIVGGSDKHIVRLIDLHTYLSVANIQQLPGGVYCVDLGPVRKQRRGAMKDTELFTIPKMAITTGKKILQIDVS